MRRLARELGSGAMSLYHYFDSRDELLDLMADTVAAGVVVPGEMPPDWREALKAVARRSRATFNAHPWLFTTLHDRPRLSPNLMRHVEQSAQAVAPLAERGVDPATMSAIVMAVDDFTIGYAVREVAAGHVEDHGRGMTRRLQEAAADPFVQYLLDSGEFPALSQFLRSGMEIEVGDRFEQGLDWLLDGIAASLGQ